MQDESGFFCLIRKLIDKVFIAVDNETIKFIDVQLKLNRI